MEFGPDRVLVVEDDGNLREHVAKLLNEAGHQVSAESSATFKTVLEPLRTKWIRN
jgi:DNA-binding response OmpR family regulator